jgi:hypothetical protein
VNPVWPAYSQKEAPIRFREGEFEYKCPTCEQWWSLALNENGHPLFWRPNSGMRRCKACWNEYHKLKMRGYSAEPGVKEVHRFKNRIRHALNRDRRNAANRAWKARNQERVREYNRAYRARKKAEANA